MELFKLCILILTSFGFVFFAIPTLIKIATNGRFMDYPDEMRKVHVNEVPILGGVAIYFGFLFTCILFLKMTALEKGNFLLASSMVIFAMGIRDDLIGLSAYKKIALQLIASFLVVYFANVRLTSLYGLFGVYDLPEIPSILFSMFTIIVITNSINLIDGIDGLAAGIGIVVSVSLGVVFYMMSETGWCRISFAVAGSLLGFLHFNLPPARIFMGDTGAYFVGFILSVLVLQFIELNKFDSIFNEYPFVKSAPAVAIGFLFIPLFDTLRVFVIRVLKGLSPLYADRNHFHHLLLDMGFSHGKTSLILVSINLLFIVLCLCFQNIGSINMMLCLLAIAIILHLLMKRMREKIDRKKAESI